MAHILVVEDDAELLDLFCQILQAEGYHTLSAHNGALALQRLNTHPVDLLITDVMMPGIDGFDLTQRIRSLGYTLPILIITAKASAADKFRGFRSGIDDYMVKPVDLHEMIWRVQALLRRSQAFLQHRIRLGGTQIDYDTLTVSWSSTNGETQSDGFQQIRQVQLTQKEFQLLFKLAASPGRVFTRRQIMADIWGVEEKQSDTHTLDVHMSRLRKAFRENPDFEIITVRGLGYKVVPK